MFLVKSPCDFLAEERWSQLKKYIKMIQDYFHITSFKAYTKTNVVLLALLIFSSCNLKKEKKLPDSKAETENSNTLIFNNNDFYIDGEFSVEKGKDAIIELMKFHNYPIYPDIRKKIFVNDFGTGKFSEIGISGIMWVNSKENKYMLMDIFLLPNQMLPEHLHSKPSDELTPPKAEGWLIRNGNSYVAEQGVNNLADFSIDIPNIHNNGTVNAKHIVMANEGDFLELNNPSESPYHWQIAGAKGAIITEVACNHSGRNLIFKDKEINEFLNGK